MFMQLACRYYLLSFSISAGSVRLQAFSCSHFVWKTIYFWSRWEWSSWWWWKFTKENSSTSYFTERWTYWTGNKNDLLWFSNSIFCFFLPFFLTVFNYWMFLWRGRFNTECIVILTSKAPLFYQTIFNN